MLEGVVIRNTTHSKGSSIQEFPGGGGGGGGLTSTTLGIFCRLPKDIRTRTSCLPGYESNHRATQDPQHMAANILFFSHIIFYHFLLSGRI